MPAPKDPAKVEEWKQKLSSVGKKPNAGHFKKGQKPWNAGGEGQKRHSDIIKKKWEKGQYANRDFSEEKNPNYRHGREIVPEYKYVLEERGEVCEVCKSEIDICVHHIDSNRRNRELDNLQVVCRSCHMKIHEPWRYRNGC